MAYADFSVKARCAQPRHIEEKLRELKARYVGEDLQTDTYYKVQVGKLKLREGNIENLLTHYLREDWAGKMKTTVFLYEINPDDAVKHQHTQSLPVIGKVVKRRKIFWIGNVKFHIDQFEAGAFVEIEAIDRDGTLGLEKIQTQVEHYRELLAIRDEDILKESYLDML